MQNVVPTFSALFDLTLPIVFAESLTDLMYGILLISTTRIF